MDLCAIEVLLIYFICFKPTWVSLASGGGGLAEEIVKFQIQHGGTMNYDHVRGNEAIIAVALPRLHYTRSGREKDS